MIKQHDVDRCFRYCTIVRFRSARAMPNCHHYPPGAAYVIQGELRMRKTMIVPAMALSLMTFGTVAAALPASAAPAHHAARTAGEDGDTTNTVPGSSGSSSGSGSGTPSGGAATGAGGMANVADNGGTNVLPWLATGGVGLALVGAAAASR